MERATLPHRTALLGKKCPSTTVTYPDLPEDDISFRSFNLYMFRATFATLPMILVLLAAVVAIILIDYCFR